MLHLYVAGNSPRSVEALANVKRVCQEHLAGRYELEVIDIYQQPELAQKARLVAVPTLIRRSPACASRSAALRSRNSNSRRVKLAPAS